MMTPATTSTTAPDHRNRNRLIVGIGLAVSAFFLYLAFRGLQPENFFASLDAVNLPLVIAAAVVFFPSLVVIAWRWQFMLRPLGFVSLPALSELVSIGYMGNNVYPLRAGEALRIYLLKRNHGIPIASATMTVIVERIFDGIVMLTFVVIGVQALDIQNETIRSVVNVATPIFFIGVTAFFGLALFPQIIRQIIERATRFLPEKLAHIIRDLTGEVLRGLTSLRTPSQLIGAVLTSYGTWAIGTVVYWLVMLAFGLELNYAVAFLVVGVVNLAGLIPASPGQLGLFEFFASTVMIAAGVDADKALAYAIVVHIVIWLPVTVAGFVLLARQGLGWKAITQAQELEAQARDVR